jgi:AcrR family transcriptional regulator
MRHVGLSVTDSAPREEAMTASLPTDQRILDAPLHLMQVRGYNAVS